MIELFVWREFIVINFEEVGHFLWFGFANLMESKRRDVVRLPFSDKRVILQKVLFLGLINICLLCENFLRFVSKN